MKLNLSVLILLSVLGGEAAGQESEFAAGRAYYMEGELKKPWRILNWHSKLTPELCRVLYWMGMAYQVTGGHRFPFAGSTPQRRAST